MSNLESNFNDQFINKLHQAYLKRVGIYHVPNDELTRFSWTENKTVTIYAIKVFTAEPGYKFYTIFFATKNSDEKNKLIILDLTNNTEDPKFFRIEDGLPVKKLLWLNSHNLLNKSIGSNIITPSANFSYVKKIEEEGDFLFENWAQKWVDQEYDRTQEAEENSTLVEAFSDFPNTKQRFFIDRYHFKDMLESLNDSQFEDEFNQCLFAYENEKWFLCATGLGSCLEHLMLIILTNYDKNGFRNEKNRGIFHGFPKNPTAQDYVRLFTKNPIKITSRQAIFINLLYMARNSVDHHNTGKTQKNLCDLLLDGISDMYNDYYSSSVLYKPTPKEDE